MSKIHCEECEKHFNEPILIMGRVARVIGYKEDETDCYIVCRELGGRVIANSMVGGHIYLDRLRGQQCVLSTTGEHWDDFVRLEKLLEYNGCPKEQEFSIDLHIPDEDYDT